MDKLDLHTPDLTARNIDAIAELLPGVVTETLDANGKPVRAIDFDALRQELSDHIVEGPQERYQLDWPGKRAAALVANAPIAKTLRPVREESVDFDTTKNFFIEGDNLDALKLLQESYLGKVKLIYMDPPYNTGGDFVYRDDFAESTTAYLAQSQQIDGAGSRLVANPDSGGRFHSNWLSMIYPRLRLARNLLTDDGVLAVSIDDNELPRLIQVGSEIFGHTGLLNVVTLKSSESSGVKMSHADRRLPKMKEYLVLFARNRSSVMMSPIRVSKTSAASDGLDRYLKYYNKIVLNPEVPVEEWTIRSVTDVAAAEGVDVYDAAAVRDFKIKNAGRVVYRTNNASLARMKFATEAAEVMSPTGIRYVWWEGKQMLFLADYLVDTLGDLWLDLSTINLNKETLDVGGFGQGQKPLALIDRLLTLFTSDGAEAIVMDLFAGSGTTAQAVLERNERDGDSRRFIVVQWPERLDPNNSNHEVATQTCRELGVPLTIAELAKERVRRASAAATCAGAGFRVFKVDTTNTADVLRSPADTTQAELPLLEDGVKDGRTGEDLLFQVLLDWGLDITAPISVEKVGGKDVFVVDDDALLACLDDGIAPDVMRALAVRRPLRVIFRDKGFSSDEARINAEQIFREVSPETELRVI